MFFLSSRDVQLKKQGYLCAGCGRDVEKGYAHRFRYCEYTSNIKTNLF